MHQEKILTDLLFVCRNKPLYEGDVFIGYDKDTVASIVLQVTEELATRQHHQKQCSDDESEAENFHMEDEAEVKKFVTFTAC